MVANESGNFLTQAPNSIWSDLDTTWTAFGPALPTTTQCFYCYSQTSSGYSNYNARVVTAQKRYSQGLTLNANFTYSHAMGVGSLPQSLTLAGASNVFNLNSDYGPQFFDRKFVFNLLGSCQLPFGKGKRWANNNPVLSRIAGGWTISPIFTFGSGLPLQIITGSGQEYGQGALGADALFSATAIPITGKASSYGNSPQFNVNAAGTVGVNGNPANGGPGANYYSDPAAVYNNFRPFILGQDDRTGGAGILRGMMRYNLDLGITKDTKFTERVGAQLLFQAFNVLNHMMWNDPGLNLQDPANFGTLTSQFNPQTLGGSLASANYTRVIQLGLRVYF